MHIFKVTNKFQKIFRIQVVAKDPDLGHNGQVMYTIQKGVNVTINSNDNFFAVDSHQGDVVVAKKPLPIGRHTIFVEAADQPVNPTERRFSLAVVTIHVISSGIYVKSSIKNVNNFYAIIFFV